MHPLHPALWGHTFCLFPLVFHSHTFLISRRITFILNFAWIFPNPLPSSGWVTDPLILRSSPASKSKAARFIPLSLPPLAPSPLCAHSLPLHVQGRWCSGLLSAAAICSNVWGYEHASLCVCRLFTNALPDGPNTARLVSGYLDSRIVTGWMTGWLLRTADWVAGSSRHLCSTDTYRTAAVPQLVPDIMMTD